MSNTPLFSIITVCYNSVHTIENTIKSVVFQKFKDFEYIIVDGNSTDGTNEIIMKYKKSIDVYISENDNGIYFAMNKAIKVSKGKYINFLNSGDVFNSKDTLSIISNSIDESTKIISCDFNIKHRNKLKRINTFPLKIENLKVDFRACHQAIFTLNSNLFYDTNFKIRSDYLWVINYSKECKSDEIKYLPESLINYEKVGFSQKHFFLDLYEFILIHYISFGIFRVFLNIHVYIIRILRFLKSLMF